MKCYESALYWIYPKYVSAPSKCLSEKILRINWIILSQEYLAWFQQIFFVFGSYEFLAIGKSTLFKGSIFFMVICIFKLVLCVIVIKIVNFPEGSLINLERFLLDFTLSFLIINWCFIFLNFYIQHLWLIYQQALLLTFSKAVGFWF